MMLHHTAGGGVSARSAGCAVNRRKARAKAASALVVTLLCSPDLGGQTPWFSVPPAHSDGPAIAPREDNPGHWAFAVSADTYLVPEDHDYIQPVLEVRRGGLHLEARYNYEALETGSLWLGYGFDGGRTFTWEFTPMLGGVFGRMAGIAPGFRGSLNYRKLTLDSEGEYVLETGHPRKGFLYNSSTLTLAPLECLYFGLATQRTRAYRTELDIQRGFVVGLNIRSLSLATYVYDWGWTAPTVVLALGADF